jgi:hypothetical protein
MIPWTGVLSAGTLLSKTLPVEEVGACTVQGLLNQRILRIDMNVTNP